MTTVLVLMTVGIVLGRFSGQIPNLVKVIDKLITWFIFLLLFLLGISVGVNDKIIENLDSIGLQALIITAGAISGSVAVLWAVYKTVFEKKGKS